MARQRNRKSKRFRAAQSRKRNKGLNANKQNRLKGKFLNSGSSAADSCSPPPSVIDSLQDTISLPSSVCEDFFQNLLEIPDPDETLPEIVDDTGNISSADCEATIKTLLNMNIDGRHVRNIRPSRSFHGRPHLTNWPASSPATPPQRRHSTSPSPNNKLVDAEIRPVLRGVRFERNSTRTLSKYTDELDAYEPDNQCTLHHAERVSRAPHATAHLGRNYNASTSRYVDRPRASFMEDRCGDDPPAIQKGFRPRDARDSKFQHSGQQTRAMRARVRDRSPHIRKDTDYTRKRYGWENGRNEGRRPQLGTKAVFSSYKNPRRDERHLGDLVWRQSLAIFHALTAHPSSRHLCHATGNARIRLALHRAAEALGAKSESFGEGNERQVNVWLENPSKGLICRTEYEEKVIGIIRDIFRPESGPYVPPSHRQFSLNSSELPSDKVPEKTLPRESEKDAVPRKAYFSENDNRLAPNRCGNIMPVHRGDEGRTVHDANDPFTREFECLSFVQGCRGRPYGSTYPLKDHDTKRCDRGLCAQALSVAAIETGNVGQQGDTIVQHDLPDKFGNYRETRNETRGAISSRGDLVVNDEVGKDEEREHEDSGHFTLQRERREVKARIMKKSELSAPDTHLFKRERERFQSTPKRTVDCGGAKDKVVIETVGPMTEDPVFEDEIDRAFSESKNAGATTSVSRSMRHRPSRKSNQSDDGRDQGAVEREQSQSVNLTPRRLGKENKGFELLRRLGWEENQGLGTGEGGRRDPVSHERRQTRRRGVGH